MELRSSFRWNHNQVVRHLWGFGPEAYQAMEARKPYPKPCSSRPQNLAPYNSGRSSTPLPALTSSTVVKNQDTPSSVEFFSSPKPQWKIQATNSTFSQTNSKDAEIYNSWQENTKQNLQTKRSDIHRSQGRTLSTTRRDPKFRQPVGLLLETMEMKNKQ